MIIISVLPCTMTGGQIGLLAALVVCVIVIIILLMIVLLTGYQILHYWRHGAFRRLVANPDDDDDDQAALENDDPGELPLDNIERNPANQDPEPNEEVPLEDVNDIHHDDEDDEVNVAQPEEVGVRPQGQPDP